MKRIAVDFDGTLFTDEYPKIGKPKWRVINWCKERKEKGDVLILWTCREGESLREAVEMCREVGLVFDYVNQNDAYLKKQFGNDCRKVGADIYLDDKAMRIEDIGESGMTEYDLKAKICDILYGVDFACGRANCASCPWLAKGYEECKNARKASALINAGFRFDEDDKQEKGNSNDELFKVAMFCAKHVAPTKVRDGGEAVQREYAGTLVKSWREWERRTSVQEIQDVLAYLLDGAIEREDDGGFVTVTILKSKFETLKKDYARRKIHDDT